MTCSTISPTSGSVRFGSRYPMKSAGGFAPTFLHLQSAARRISSAISPKTMHRKSKNLMARTTEVLCAIAITVAMVSCGTPPAPKPAQENVAAPSDLKKIEHVIVIYQENWSFDSLYGLFPGANGISRSSRVSLAQRDRLTGKPYTSQRGQPFDLVSGSLSLTTPPQPINSGQIDTRFP